MGSGRSGLSGPRRCPLPCTAPFPLLAARSPFPFRRRWDRDRDRDLDRVYETCLRFDARPIAADAAAVKERLFRSIPKIDSFFRSCRSRRLIDCNGWIASALDSDVAFSRYVSRGDRPTPDYDATGDKWFLGMLWPNETVT